VPLYAGFGISSGAHARAAGALVDGVVVGSAAVAAAEGGPEKLARLVHELRAGLDAA
jgi:tryptophan synthase alpha subunit